MPCSLLLKSPKAAGAFLIATTSGNVQAGRLIEMDAEHANDYDHDPAQGDTAKSYTPDHLGLHLAEVGKPETRPQFFKAIAMAGVTGVIGLFGGISRSQRNFVN